MGIDHFYLQHVQNFKKGSLDKPQVYEICVLLKNLYLVKCQANITDTEIRVGEKTSQFISQWIQKTQN